MGYLIAGKTVELTVGDSPHTVGGDTSGHVPVLSVDDEVGINVAKFLKGVIDLRSEHAVDEEYIGGDNLFLPGLSGELPVSEERSTNFTVCTIATNDIVSFKGDFAIGGFASHSGGLVVLFNPNDFM